MNTTSGADLVLHRAADRGRTRLDWLDSWHSFSFGSFVDPTRMGFGPLRVINDDVIAPGRGFDTHPHRDMEILTWVLSGELEHQDSTGGGAVLRPGELQRMSAGRGILHREWNPSPDEEVHLLQIWLQPHTRGAEPRWEQRAFDIEHGVPTVLASGRDEGGLSMHQDASLSVLRLGAGEDHQLSLPAGRLHWIHTARGATDLQLPAAESGDSKGSVQDSSLTAGDALAISGAAKLDLHTTQELELLLFDLPSHD